MVCICLYYLYRYDGKIIVICLKEKLMNFNKDFKGYMYDIVVVFCKVKIEIFYFI